MSRFTVGYNSWLVGRHLRLRQGEDAIGQYAPDGFQTRSILEARPVLTNLATSIVCRAWSLLYSVLCDSFERLPTLPMLPASLCHIEVIDRSGLVTRPHLEAGVISGLLLDLSALLLGGEDLTSRGLFVQIEPRS